MTQARVLNPTTDPEELNRRADLVVRISGVAIIIFKLIFVGFAVFAIAATIVINLR
ncbi:hypothetical protein MES5069_910008 [Mesorhizobium escarrei]|uniref:Uncharacterized protein n=1 Tax=Mesorhizobium escarrei TaxID=666018 RepID=A0ABM9EKZ3_9HYPH|nr:hypothetical protein MES5069_910008 [Mesorhizobium escarrei]